MFKPQLVGLSLLTLTFSGACASMNTESTARTAGSPEPPVPTGVVGTEPGVIPVGHALDVRLQSTLSSETAEVEQRFEATTAADVTQDGRVLVPAGSVVRGIVAGVDRAGRIDRTGRLTLRFDRITARAREYPIRATATQVFESQGIQGEARTIGTAGAVGAIVGGIIDGLSGAVIGAIVGSGGVIAATEGKDVTLPAGTIVRIRLDTRLEIRS